MFFFPDLLSAGEEIHGRRCMYAVLDPHWRNVGLPTVSLGGREFFATTAKPPLPLQQLGGL